MTNLRQYLLSLPGKWDEHRQVFTLDEPATVELTCHNPAEKVDVTKIYSVKEVWPKTPLPGVPFRFVKGWKNV